MAQENFKRYEKKYMLNREQYHALVSDMMRWMSADEYGKHTISNIYFDTRDYLLIRQSIEKPQYKEKVRLRAYGQVDEDSTVFVELKKKFEGVVYKRRIPMRLEAARKYLCYGIYPDRDSQILREIDYVMRLYDLKPAALVAYDRIAFLGKDDAELRVTFDKNIRCRDYRLDLKKGSYGSKILGDTQSLMEIKIPGAMPLWMSALLSELEIFPVSFSKYGEYYRKELSKNLRLEGGVDCA